MAAIDRERMSRTLKSRNDINSSARHFIVTDEILSTYEKTYKYVDPDIRLLRFAQEAMGTVSDAFILYAVALLGVADRYSIQQFLRAIKGKTPELSVFDPEDTDGLRRRLSSLKDNGFLFRCSYQIDGESKQYMDKGAAENIVLYTLEESSQSFMNSKLGCHTRINKWIMAKPPEELIGWAAASYACIEMSRGRFFSRFNQGIFSTTNIGTVMMNPEVVYEKGDIRTYVATFPIFLKWNKSRQSEAAYDDFCIRKINVIKNYLFYQEQLQGNKYAFVVLVAENLEDLEKMKELILSTEVLLKRIKNIYFTGEGILRKADGISAFLQLYRTDNGYEFINTKPIFMIEGAE